MTLVRRLARPLLAAPFIAEGLDMVRHPAPRAERARPMVAQLAKPLHLPEDPQTFVRANGAAMAGSGTLLALGRLPRASALVLAASVVPSTYAEHRFWEKNDPEAKRREQAQFLTGLGLLGGALLAAVDTEGRPGLAWRTRRAAKDAGRAARTARREAKVAAKQARREARHAGHQARREARHAGRRASSALHH
jgi:putative oxidoreductase